MKRAVLCLALAGLICVNTGCYGSFALTQKVYKWNGSLGNKFVSSIVFWVFCILPVYEISAIIDTFALNVIQFWAGSNPLALNADTEIQKIVESNGKIYQATMGKGKITILETKGPDAGKSIVLTYKKEALAWYMTAGGKTQMIASFDPQPLNNVNLIYPNGKVVSQSMDMPSLASATR